jgi:hypothetical protein
MFSALYIDKKEYAFFFSANDVSPKLYPLFYLINIQNISLIFGLEETKRSSCENN